VMPTLNEDGFVIAVDKQGRYVECFTLGEFGFQRRHPGALPGHRDPAGGPGNKYLQPYSSGSDARTRSGKTLMYATGHYSPGVVRITVSFGVDAAEFPATMADGCLHPLRDQREVADDRVDRPRVRRERQGDLQQQARHGQVARTGQEPGTRSLPPELTPGGRSAGRSRRRRPAPGPGDDDRVVAAGVLGFYRAVHPAVGAVQYRRAELGLLPVHAGELVGRR